jgi:uncharacterized RDD family membrane protein YckC
VELEDRITVPGAEGIDLQLVLAGIGSRSVALLVDLLLQTALLWLLGLLIIVAGDLGVAAVAIGSFSLLLGYPTLFEGLWRGRTPGKALLGISVVSLDGSPVRLQQALIRNVVRFVDVLPGTYLVGLVAVLASSRSQRVGDVAAGTLVVRAPRAPRAARGFGEAPDLGWDPSTRFDPATIEQMVRWDVSALTADELAAMRSFLSRRHQLAPAARSELATALANQAAPKVAGVPLDGGPEAVLERIVASRLSR